MKIFSWNVNGIRSAGQKGFFEWLAREKPDVVCLQETKARPEQLEASYTAPFGYQTFWHSSEKPGYSGVAMYSRIPPRDVHDGVGVPEIDREGRVLTADFGAFVLINAYFPNSQREHSRLPYKLEFCKEILAYCEKYRGKGRNLLLCGDYNIAHKEIDLKNPKTNQDNAGFLPQERAWMDRFLAAGYVDTFRHFTPDPGHYTWWSYRPGVRERNIGWRIDYFCANQEFISAVEESSIHAGIFGSDHCPVSVRMNGARIKGVEKGLAMGYTG